MKDSCEMTERPETTEVLWLFGDKSAFILELIEFVIIFGLFKFFL